MRDGAKLQFYLKNLTFPLWAASSCSGQACLNGGFLIDHSLIMKKPIHRLIASALVCCALWQTAPVFGADASVPPEIENEQILGISKQPAHATLMLYGSAAAKPWLLGRPARESGRRTSPDFNIMSVTTNPATMLESSIKPMDFSFFRVITIWFPAITVTVSANGAWMIAPRAFSGTSSFPISDWERARVGGGRRCGGCIVLRRKR